MSTKTINSKYRAEPEKSKKSKNGQIKIYVDSTILKKASKALFDFDIEKYVSKKDLRAWKK